MAHLDWDQLRQTSLNPGGFGNERATIWPQVLNASTSISPTSSEPLQTDETVAHKEDPFTHQDERQIMLDTDRSFVHYPSGESDITKEEMKTGLNELIASVFRKHPALNYYQGYHDIISVLFLTLPHEIQSVSVKKLSLHRLRDSMGPGLEPLIGLLRLLKNLLRLADPEYAQLLERNIPMPYYALSNLLTLFSHDMPTLALIQHTFDYLLVRPPVACVYVAAAIILSRKEEITWFEAVGEGGMLHSILSSLPVLYEEGGEGDPTLPAPEVEAIRGIKDEDTGGSTDEKTKVYTLPNGNHIFEPIVEAEGSLVKESTVDSLSTESLLDVGEGAMTQPLQTNPLSVPRGDVAVDRNLSSSTPDLLVIESDGKVVDGETVATKSPPPTEDDTRLIGESATKTESEPASTSTSTPPSELEPEVADAWPDIPSQPTKARMSLSSLLRQADSLLARFPPSHSQLALDKIMGPRSVAYTWKESFSFLLPDDEVEQYVKTPELIVLPYVDPVEETMLKERQERELEMRRVGRRKKLRKSIFATANAQKKTMFVGAVFALGIAMAVYGIRTPGDMGRSRGDLRRLLRYVGGLLLAGGDKFVRRLLGR